MTMVVRSTYIETVRLVRMPLTVRAHNRDKPSFVADGYCYRSISGSQALGLAIVAAMVTPALLWLVL